MPSYPRGSIRWLLVAAAALAGWAGPAAADTIYLKDGRVLRATEARIEGDRVIFSRFGQEQAIPLAIVDRVEEDDHTDPAPTPRPRPLTIEPVGADGALEEDAGAAEPGAGEAADEVPVEETREYWEARVLVLRQERAELLAQLERLRRIERAFLFSHRSTAETRREIEAVEERLAGLDEADLRREARRLGIPPGWLRIRAPRVAGPGTGG